MASLLCPPAAYAQYPTHPTLNVKQYLGEDYAGEDVQEAGLSLPPGAYLLEVTTDRPVNRVRVTERGSSCLMAGGEVYSASSRFDRAVFPIRADDQDCLFDLNMWLEDFGDWVGGASASLSIGPGNVSYRAGGLDIEVVDRDGGHVIDRLGAGSDVTVPASANTAIRVRRSPSSGARKARIEHVGEPYCQFTDEDVHASPDGRYVTSTNTDLIFGLTPSRSCEVRVGTWASVHGWEWSGGIAPFGISRSDVRPITSPQIVRPPRYDFTNGTAHANAVRTGTPGPRGNHGFRFPCVPSHFSYDDPIVYPGQPGAAHLHMFLGNTSADAFSTRRTLDSQPDSTCTGGASTRSSYWMPALLDAEGQATLPSKFFVYYKSFFIADGRHVVDPDMISPIPSGLELLAHRDTKNASYNPAGRRDRGHLRVYETSNGTVGLVMAFPQCLRLRDDGSPMLSSREVPGNEDGSSVNAHAAYQGGGDRYRNDCPRGFPYRIPGMSLNVLFDDVPFASDWQLSSDAMLHEGAPGYFPGHSLHADYIAVWDAAVAEAMVECNVEAHGSCGFSVVTDADRAAERERELSVDGTTRLYQYGHVLLPETDRTPFGDALPPTLHGGH